MNKLTGFTTQQKWWLFLSVWGAGLSFWLLMMTGNLWQIETKKKQEVGQLKAKLMKIDELKVNKEILEVRVTNLDNFLVKDEKGIAKAATALELAAADNELKLTFLMEDFPKQVDIQGKYQLGLGFNVSLEGTFQKIVNWLKETEKLPYLIKFEEVKLGVTKTGKGVKADFKGVIFLTNE